MLRVGILMPRSTLYPSIGLDFLEACKVFLKTNAEDQNLQYFIDNIGFGIQEADIYTKAEKMLLQDDADIVIVFADTRIGELLEPLFTACNKIMILVHMGANLPFHWQPAATTINHTLNFSICSWLTGKKVAAENSKETINLVSYYDAGYSVCNAMLTGHLKNGGLPVLNHITHLKLSEFTLTPVVDFLESHHDIKTCLCLFSGEQAEKFMTEIPALEEKYNLNLFAAPMLFEEGLQSKPTNGKRLKKLAGFVPWHKNLDNKNNTSFLGNYKKKGNYFSLLGWETGQLIQAIMTESNKGTTSAVDIVKNMEGQLFDSPRGRIKLDPVTHYTYGPVYWAIQTDDSTALLENPLEKMEEEWLDFTGSDINDGIISGWKNTYLCI